MTSDQVHELIDSMTGPRAIEDALMVELMEEANAKKRASLANARAIVLQLGDSVCLWLRSGCTDDALEAAKCLPAAVALVTLLEQGGED